MRNDGLMIMANSGDVFTDYTDTNLAKEAREAFKSAGFAKGSKLIARRLDVNNGRVSLVITVQTPDGWQTQRNVAI